GADLMAHVRQEGGLRPTGRLSGIPGGFQHILGKFLFGNIVGHGGKTADHAQIIPQSTDQNFGPKPGAVLSIAPTLLFGTSQLSGLAKKTFGLSNPDILIGEKERIGYSNGFHGAVALQALRPFIPNLHSSIGIEKNEGTTTHTLDQSEIAGIFSF